MSITIAVYNGVKRMVTSRLLSQTEEIMQEENRTDQFPHLEGRITLFLWLSAIIDAWLEMLLSSQRKSKHLSNIYPGPEALRLDDVNSKCPFQNKKRPIISKLVMAVYFDHSRKNKFNIYSLKHLKLQHICHIVFFMEWFDVKLLKFRI